MQVVVAPPDASSKCHPDFFFGGNSYKLDFKEAREPTAELKKNFLDFHYTISFDSPPLHASSAIYCLNCVVLWEKEAGKLP